MVGGEGASTPSGLYAAGLAVTLGAGRVVYLDDESARLAIAAAFGAEPMEGPPPRKAGAFPITVNAAARRLACCAPSAARSSTGGAPARRSTFKDPPLPMLKMYSRCRTMHSGRAHVRPTIPRVLEATARGFNPSLVTSAVVSWDDAEAVLRDPPMKLGPQPGRTRERAGC